MVPSPPSLAVLFALPEESREFLRACPAGVAVEHTGVGPEAAARRTGEILRERCPSLLISAGFAGGLQAAATLGTVICDFRGLEFPLPGGCLTGPIVSRSQVIETAAEKARLGAATGALAVDMETESIAQAAAAAGVPTIAVRTVSDPVGSDLPVPMAVWFDLAIQRPRPAALVAYLLRHPGRILPFARFVRGLAPARRNLADALVGLTDRVLRPSSP